MLIDREAWGETINNAAELRAAGLEVVGKQPTVIGVGWTGYWLDPQGKDFGENAKYLKYSEAEARKLLTAAGASKREFNFCYNREPTYGPAYARAAQVYAGMWGNGGLEVKQQGLAYQEFLSNYFFGYIQKNFAAGVVKGHDGVMQVAERPYESAAQILAASFHSDGGGFHGLSPDGRDPHKGDPKLNDMIEKVRSEFDRPKQQSLIHDAIRYITGQMYSIPRPMTARPFSLSWPVVANNNAYSRYANNHGRWTEDNLSWWIDDTKPPLKS